MQKNVVLEKSINFAMRIVDVCRYLATEKKEFVLSKELLVAGTHIGKHVKEAVSAESRPMFASEFGVAKRKASETEYWLILLYHAKLIDEQLFLSLDSDRIELAKLVNSIISSTRKNG